MKIDADRAINALLALQRKAHDDGLLAHASGYMSEEWRADGRADGIQEAINLINLLACKRDNEGETT